MSGTYWRDRDDGAVPERLTRFVEDLLQSDRSRAEVEDELMQSPYFQEVCVLGRKSEKGGEEVFAVIVPNEDAFKDRGETGREEEIIAHEVKAASSRLADYKRVQKFGVVDQELPKTTTLKHKRPEIVKLLEEKGFW